MQDLRIHIEQLKSELLTLKVEKQIDKKEFYMITLKQGFGSKVIHDTEDIATKEAMRLSKIENKPAYIMKMYKIYFNGIEVELNN